MTTDQDRLVAYALGTLSDREVRQVEAYLKGHPHDAAQVRDNLEALTALVLSQEPEDVPGDADKDLLERIRKEASSEESIIRLPNRRGWQLGVSFAAAAAIAGFAWLGFLEPVYQDFRINQRLARVQNQAGAMSEMLVNDNNETIGTLVRLPDNRLFVVFEDEPPKNQVYQGWAIAGAAPVSLGTWQERMLVINQPLAAESSFGVTLEPLGGSPQPTSTPLVLYTL